MNYCIYYYRDIKQQETRTFATGEELFTEVSHIISFSDYLQICIDKIVFNNRDISYTYDLATMTFKYFYTDDKMIVFEKTFLDWLR